MKIQKNENGKIVYTHENVIKYKKQNENMNSLRNEYDYYYGFSHQILSS